MNIQRTSNCSNCIYPTVSFCTNSTYSGEWNEFGISGKGVFTFQNGVKYNGSFHEGQFHGKGKIIFPDGSVFNGTWLNGKSTDLSMTFSDGLKYETDDWMYCKNMDRRLKECRFFGIPNFKKIVENWVDIPKNCYDMGEGFYNSKNRTIIDYKTNEVLRIPTIFEQNWIKNNCRKSSIEDLCQLIRSKNPAKRNNERRKTISIKFHPSISPTPKSTTVVRPGHNKLFSFIQPELFSSDNEDSPVTAKSSNAARKLLNKSIRQSFIQNKSNLLQLFKQRNETENEEID